MGLNGGPGPGLTLCCYNSASFHHTKLPKVANERYCNIFYIFWVIWGYLVGGCPLGGIKKTKKHIFNSAIFHHKMPPPRRQMKDIAMYFQFIWSFGVWGKGVPPLGAIKKQKTHFFNLANCDQKILPMVENKIYYKLFFFIFGPFGVWSKGLPPRAIYIKFMLVCLFICYCKVFYINIEL